jgi:hypothetical protein
VRTRTRIAGLALIVASLSACGATAATPEGGTVQSATITNEDPKNGPVFVRTLSSEGYAITTFKFCDGTTLVYNYMGGNKGGGSTIADSPECGAPKPTPEPTS